jgi:hypothetical protein
MALETRPCSPYGGICSDEMFDVMCITDTFASEIGGAHRGRKSAAIIPSSVTVRYLHSALHFKLKLTACTHVENPRDILTFVLD